jgi:hypothetical protein
MPTEEELYEQALAQYWISGDIGSLGANIPISNPEALSLSAETDIAGNIITSGWTPMEKALLFQLQRRF